MGDSWAQSYANARRALESGGYWPTSAGVAWVEDPGVAERCRQSAYEAIDRLSGAELFAVYILTAALAGKSEGKGLGGFERAIQDWD
jgi:hypothetical protein